MNKRRIPTRFVLVFSTFLISVLLYIDRACISVAKKPVLAELGFNDEQWAWILAAFTLGYALCQVPSGWLADRFGPRGVLTMVIALWSLFTGLTGAARSFLTMLCYRFFFGAGEAGAFPAMARAVFAWIPLKERGTVQGINFSGSRLGAAFAFPLVAYMIATIGWRKSFWTFAGVGFIFAAVWWWWFRNEPKEHGGVSDEELNFIHANRQKAGGGDTDEQPPLTLGTLFGSKNVWFAIVQYIASNFTFFFCLSWAYPYLREQFGLGPTETGVFAMIPLIFGALGNWSSGILVDKIYRSGKWTLSRRLPAQIGFLLAAIGMVFFAFTKENQYLAVAFLSLAIFGADMTLSPSWTFCIDIGRKYAGAVSGTMNMAGNFSSFATTLAFYYLAEYTGSKGSYFGMAAALNVLAIICWMFMKSDRKLEEY